jgi:uncharacterized protein YPO0396
MTMRDTAATNPTGQFDLALAGPGLRPGMRLASVEVLNWGTFDKRVWSLNLDGQNGLLTGDIGSGKSTFVDAITTLLVPAQRISYNKAAGAEAKERDLRSYVLGHYKSERGDTGLSARAVSLRDYNTYSVILARFRNEGFGEDVTLAQVFYFRDREGQPTRFYVVGSAALNIAKHFTFEKDIGALKKRLKKLPRVDVFDSFPPYGAAFRRLFGIESEQALDLFHQTVSMKSVGDLTDFVRAHMLEAFDVEARITQMISHFDDLNRAHETVLKTKAQITRLEPLVADCTTHTQLTGDADAHRAARAALSGFFADIKAALAEERISKLDAELQRLAARLDTARLNRANAQDRRDQLKQSIAENGGDRIESIGRDIATKTVVKAERQHRADQYDRLAKLIGLSVATDSDGFNANAIALTQIIETAEATRASLDNDWSERQSQFRALKDEHDTLSGEIKSLEGRRSNLPARMLTIRQTLCAALGLDETALPFAGELIAVRAEARDWEGAAERLLHGFAQSLLVADDHYPLVAEWVDRTKLGGRLVYYRVRSQKPGARPELSPRALVNKLALKSDSPFYPWLDREIAARFDHVCCDTLDAFRREERAITRMGQMKGRGQRHEKDDRSAIDDRTRFVLGWSNEGKIRALKAAAKALEIRIADLAGLISKLEAERRAINDRLAAAGQVKVYTSFLELDWRSLALEIEQLEAERRQLEAGSDTLRTLRAQLATTDHLIGELAAKVDGLIGDQGGAKARHATVVEAREELQRRLAEVDNDTRETVWPRLLILRAEVAADQRLTLESCAAMEGQLRDRLTSKIDALSRQIATLRDRIVKAMQAYSSAYPTETREVDDTVEAAEDFARMLAELVSDGLPRFEARFKALLNENTINEVAGFQSQLNRERQQIRERIELINQSLHEIDYNAGRYIKLVAEQTLDQDVRDFIQDLRSCTEGALTGSDDAEYSEAKFLQVKRIIERFKGRDKFADFDRRWMRKVTDVRNWFVFSASERWREDDREHEHYTDSGGKSGGQKEKLAYTVLAASLAYQFGIDPRQPRSRSFHFVVIDEAFGRGSDESAAYGLDLFAKMNLQLLVATPLQKIHIIEPFVAAVGFVHNEGGNRSMLRNLTIEQYRDEQQQRDARKEQLKRAG